MYKPTTSFFTNSLNSQPLSKKLLRLKSHLIKLLIYKLYKTVDALITNTHYDVMEIIARRKYVDQLKQGQLDKLLLGMSFAKDKNDLATVLLRDAGGLIKLQMASSLSGTDSAPESSELHHSLYSITAKQKPKTNTPEEKKSHKKTQSERDLRSINAMIASRLIKSRSSLPNTNSVEMHCKFENDFTTDFKDIISPISNKKIRSNHSP